MKTRSRRAPSAPEERRGEPPVLEDAAREADGPDARGRAASRAQLAGDLGDRLVERAPRGAPRAARRRGPRAAPAASAAGRRRAGRPARTTRTAAARAARSSGRDLQVDRGLRLVLGDVADAEEARRRVEEPAGRRGERGVEPARHLGPDDARPRAGRGGRGSPARAPGRVAVGHGALRAAAVVRARTPPRRAGSRAPSGTAACTASAPPGIGARPNRPTRRYPARSATRISPPQNVPSSPIPRPS